MAILAAPAFDSGSNGSYGAMNITNSTTLDMPPDGIFHCTTINIAAGANVRFNRNALNTPVYLLAQSNVVISGGLDLNGEPAAQRLGSWNPGLGGPGGFDGGFGAYGNLPPSNGQGPGGGKVTGGDAVHAVPNSLNTNVYGNVLCSPLVGGSGAAGGLAFVEYGGAGGGGAI